MSNRSIGLAECLPAHLLSVGVRGPGVRGPGVREPDVQPCAASGGAACPVR